MSDLLYNRLKKNFKKLSSWAKESHLDAYRLYDRDIPEIPYIIDYYSQHFIIYEKGKKLDEEEISLREKHSNEVIEAIKKLFNVDDSKIFYKQRIKQKGLAQYEKLARDSKELIVNEFKAKFIVNLTDYLDTGLFLDHRPMRKLIFKQAQNKKMLNLFSYTCAVSVAAAIGGAKTTSVDLSNTYINWGKRNFELNQLNLNEHQFITQDCMKFLESHFEKYDLIFIDPPSFSNSKKFEGVFDVQTSHQFLIEKSMSLLNSGGVLYFSTNFRDFKLEPNLNEKFKIKNITASTIPMDFRDQKIHYCFEIKAM